MKFYFNSIEKDFEIEMIGYLFREMLIKYDFPQFELDIYDNCYLQLFVKSYDRSRFIEDAKKDLYEFFTENPLRNNAAYISVKPYILPEAKWEIKFDKVKL